MKLARKALARAITAAGFLALCCCSSPPPKTAAPPPPPTATPIPLSPTPTPRPYDYPVAPRGDAVDDYHGTRVADPYRSLENAEDPATSAWVDAENALTRRVLNRPLRETLKARITELVDYPRISVPTRKGRFYFFFKNTGLQNQSVYFVQEGTKGEPRVLIDPNTLSSDGTVALSNVSPTRDGKLLGYALSRSGSDRQEIYVREVATGRDLPDKLLWAKFTSIAWTADDRGFFYTRYPEPGTVPKGDENYFPKLCYHRLGDPQGKDRLIFEKPAEKEVFIGAGVSYDGQWLLIQAVKGSGDRSEVHVLDLRKPGGKPVPVFSGYEHGYTIADVVRGKLYTRTDRDAPLGRVIAVDLTRGVPGVKGDARFVEIVPASGDNLTFATIVNGTLVVDALHNASDQLIAYSLKGRRLNEIGLPGIGSVGALTGEPDQTEMFLSFTSFTVPSTNYRYDFATKDLALFQKPEVKVDTALYETEQIWYPSKDGTKVSMFLVHKKGVAKDGDRPTYLTAYGGFDVNLTPYFLSSDFVLLERSGVIAIPNLRGGGEYGEAWHQAGMREKKQNVFDDFIAAAQWLIGDGWTKPARLAIDGGSNGGLLVSAVLTQRPELFGAVVCEVPVADMLRYHKYTIGSYWIPEYGNPDLAADFPFLYKYSPYHNVRDGVRYPATLVTGADTDDRVTPGHAKKLAARLQAATAGDAPILLRVETKAGHGSGKPTSKRIDEASDIWTFVFWRLGLNS